MSGMVAFGLNGKHTFLLYAKCSMPGELPFLWDKLTVVP